MVTEVPAPFVIAIVGGGIGGLCTALSLHHQCKEQNVEIHVYEQAAQYREIGAGVAIGINAAKLLHRVGVGDAANEIAGRRNGVWISYRRYDDSNEIVTVYLDDKPKVRALPVLRSEFLDLLVKTVNERRVATLHTNKRCVNVVESGDKVQIQFEDGTSAAADLVVGCDGIHSAIRNQFVADNPSYSGRVAFRGLVPIEQLKSSWLYQTYSCSWLGKDKHFLVFPISQNKILNIVAFVSIKKEELGTLQESWTATGDRAEVAKHFEDFDEPVRKIIGLMGPKPSKWILNDRNPIEQWTFMDGKVVMVGDAAHAMLPHQGAGAGQAIEDGYILGRALSSYLQTRQHRDNASLGRWMGLYQAVRLPRAQKAQETARQAGDVYEMQTESMKGKSYEECIPIIHDSLKDRMKWIWNEDIDVAYEGALKATGLDDGRAS